VQPKISLFFNNRIDIIRSKALKLKYFLLLTQINFITRTYSITAQNSGSLNVILCKEEKSYLAFFTKLRWIFLVLFLLPLGKKNISHAQNAQPLKDYAINVWSIEEGLRSNNLRHITKDKDGFLWISTFNGLVRFDGIKFKTFDIEIIPIISTSVFYSVLPYGDNEMFISTQSSGIIQYKNGGFNKLTDDSSLPSSIQTPYLDSNNRLWIGTRNAGVYYFEKGKLSRFSIPSLNDQSINCFTTDKSGNLVTIQLYKWSVLVLIDRFDNFELVNHG